MSRSSIWFAILVTVVTIIVGSPGSAADRISPKSPPEKSTESEMKALSGTWAATHYDFDGRTRQAMKRGEVLRMSLDFNVAPSVFGDPGKDGGMIRLTRTRLQTVDWLNPNNAAEMFVMGCKLDVSSEPYAIRRDTPDPNPNTIIYRRTGDTMTLRILLRNDQVTEDSLKTKKGDGIIVYHLRREQKAAVGSRGGRTRKSVPQEAATPSSPPIEQKQPAPRKEEKPAAERRQAVPDTQAVPDKKAKLSTEDLYGKWVGVKYAEKGDAPRKFSSRQSASLELSRFSVKFTLDLGPDKGTSYSWGRHPNPAFEIDGTKAPVKFYYFPNPQGPRLPWDDQISLKGDELLWHEGMHGEITIWFKKAR